MLVFFLLTSDTPTLQLDEENQSSLHNSYDIIGYLKEQVF